MQRFITLALVTGTALFAASAAVQAQSAIPFASKVPGSGWYFGLGGSYDAVNFGTQNLYAVGTSNAYQSGALVASGSAAGPTNVYLPLQSTLAPSAQIGYFQHLANSNWLWGAKFTYSYLGTTATASSFLIPQAGSFTSGGTTTSFTGNAPVSSYQAIINHQLAWLLSVGRSFDNVTVYFGAGPSLSQVQTRLNGVTGFADINGTPTLIAPSTNFASSQWVFGGALSVGATYFLSPNWFLDFSYTYDATLNQTANYAAPFTNTSGTLTTVGTLSGNSSGRVTTQAFTVTVNMLFDVTRRAAWLD